MLSTLTNLLPLLLAALALLVLLLALARRLLRPRRPKLRRGNEAPQAGSRFFCAHCAGPFAHTPRTLKAWERGSRRFFCERCQAERAREMAEAPFGASSHGPDGPDSR